MLEIWRYRRLLRELVRRDLRARYKVSVLGFFWSLLRPLLSILIISVVFTFFAPLPHESFPHVPYFAFLLCGYLLWSYLVGALVEGTQALLANAHLIKKVSCPRLIFPLAVVLSHLFNTALALLVLLPGTYLVAGISVPWTCVLVFPLLILETCLLVGLVWWLAGLNVLYRDVTQILEFITLAWFYVTPIIYSIDLPINSLARLAGGWLTYLYLLNPMAFLIYAARWACLGTPPGAGFILSGPMLGLSATVFVVVSLAAPFVGRALFSHIEIRAVDEL